MVKGGRYDSALLKEIFGSSGILVPGTFVGSVVLPGSGIYL